MWHAICQTTKGAFEYSVHNYCQTKNQHLLFVIVQKPWKNIFSKILEVIFEQTLKHNLHTMDTLNISSD